MAIEEIEYSNLIENFMLQYYNKVITDRHIPDIQDGLKPIQRRLLYTMHKYGMSSNKSFLKSMRITGLTSESHPHGQASSYEALTGMIVKFTNNQNLVHGHGAFHNIKGDPDSADRYSEAKLNKFSEEVMLKGINNKITDFKPTFDSKNLEPVVLPSRIPMVLVNGSYGIGAGGISSYLPPHDFESVVRATKYVIDNPECTSEDLVKKVKLFPNFPFGGVAELDENSLSEIYSNGTGNFRLRSKIEFDTTDKKYDIIRILELPYLVRLGDIMPSIREEVKKDHSKKANQLNGDELNIKDMIDYTKEDYLRLDIKYPKGTDLEAALNILIKRIRGIQMTMSVNMNLLKNGRLISYNGIKDIISDWLSFRRSTVKRERMNNIKIIDKRINILKALIRVLDPKFKNEFIQLIQESTSRSNLIELLEEKYSFNEIQSNYLADLKAYNLNKGEIENYKSELKEKEEEFNKEFKFLEDESRIDKFIKEEMDEIISSKYILERTHQTEYISKFNDSKDAHVPDEEFLIIATSNNFIKKVKLDTNNTQKRNGKGRSIGKIKEGYYPIDVLQSFSKDIILLITKEGNIFKYNTFDIPENKSISTLGTNITSMIRGQNLAKVITISEKDFNDDRGFLLVATKKNKIKMTSMKEFKNIGKSGLILAKLQDKDDKIVGASFISDKLSFQILAGNSEGNVIRMTVNDIPINGRTTYGSSIFKKKKNAKEEPTVVSCLAVPSNGIEGESLSDLVFLNSLGIGKRVDVNEFKLTGRYTTGIIGISGDSPLMFMGYVNKDEIDNCNLTIISDSKSITINLSDVKLLKRTSKGNYLKRLDNGEKISAAAITEG